MKTSKSRPRAAGAVKAWHTEAAKEIQAWAQSGALHCPDDELVSVQAQLIAKHDPQTALGLAGEGRGRR